MVSIFVSHLMFTLVLNDYRFDIGDSGQQVHIAFGPAEPKSSRHPCFKIGSPEALLELRQRIWEHHQKGDDSAPQEADKPGEEASGAYALLQLFQRLRLTGRQAQRASNTRKGSSLGTLLGIDSNSASEFLSISNMYAL